MTVTCDKELLTISTSGYAADVATEERRSYGQIFKSSVLVGGSSVLNIALGIVRTKAMALLLGPAGFGLAGLYGSILDLAQNVAGMGVNSSGVRQIAEAVGTNDTNKIAQTSVVLRRTSILLGVFGAVMLVLFSRQVSALTFGTPEKAGAVCVLSIAIFFRLVSGGQSALIQGMRHIADLAKMGVLGAFCGTIISIPMVYFWRERGIVPSLVAVAAMTIVTSWWYSRKIQVQAPALTVAEIGREAAALLKLGLAFMSSGLMTLGVAYVVRITVLHRLGFQATGLYQSAWTLGGLYVGFILQAMGADFYPRLTASATDNAACNRLVNEQARVGLLLAAPGVIATLTFAPLVIILLYSSRFGSAVEVLRWICLGTMLQVVTWPMGYIILAKGKSRIFFLSEAAWTVVAITLAWLGVRFFGLNGAGMAFFGSYIFHAILIYPIVNWLSGFRWSDENKRTGSIFFLAIAIVFGGFFLLPLNFAVCLGSAMLLLSTVYSIRDLSRLITPDQLPRPVRQLLGLFVASFDTGA